MAALFRWDFAKNFPDLISAKFEPFLYLFISEIQLMLKLDDKCTFFLHLSFMCSFFFLKKLSLPFWEDKLHFVLL
jgi:hypothetical protein